MTNPFNVYIRLGYTIGLQHKSFLILHSHWNKPFTHSNKSSIFYCNWEEEKLTWRRWFCRIICRLPFVKFNLLPKIEVSHFSGDLLLVSEVREGGARSGDQWGGCTFCHNSVACLSGNPVTKNPTHLVTYIAIRDDNCKI